MRSSVLPRGASRPLLVVLAAALATASCGMGETGVARTSTSRAANLAPAEDVPRALTIRDDFGNGLAPTAAGWSDAARASRAAWRVTRAGTLTHDRPAENSVGLLVIGRPEWSDIGVATKVRLAPGMGAGVAVRHSARGSYRVTWHVTDTGSRLVLARVDGAGTTTELDRIDDGVAAATSGSSHRLELRAIGHRITALVDGTPRLDARDDTLPTGVAGLVATDAPTQFDDVEVRTTVDSFTIAVLPDTQYYAKAAARGNRPDIFGAQTRWLAAKRATESIAFVVHAGDVVDGACDAAQWRIASRAMRTLDGKLGYAVAPGNHDILDYDGSCADGRGGTISRKRIGTGIYNAAANFPPARFRRTAPSTWAGSSPATDAANSLHRFDAGGVPFSVVTLQWGPFAQQVTWAKRALARTPRRVGIVLTHDYLDGDAQLRGTRPEHEQLPDLPGQLDGAALWRRLVAPSPNARFVFSGHVRRCPSRTAAACERAGVAARRITRNVAGVPVAQLVADYQVMSSGGGGFLRLVRITPGEDRVDVRTWSPSERRFLTDSSNRFTLRDFPLSAAD